MDPTSRGTPSSGSPLPDAHVAQTAQETQRDDKTARVDAPHVPSHSTITPPQQQAAMVVFVVCLLVLGVDRAGLWWRQQQRIEIGRADGQARSIQLAVDLNHATWPELTLLPEISETMARRIVAFREQKGRFHSLDELKQVRGIGPRTFALVRPYLKPIPAQRDESIRTSTTELDAAARPPSGIPASKRRLASQRSMRDRCETRPAAQRGLGLGPCHAQANVASVFLDFFT